MPSDVPGDRSLPATPRVLRFPRAGAGTSATPPPVADIARYQGTEDGAEYRHRMLVNAAAFIFVISLIGAGLWLADTLAQMRRNQDCVLSGRDSCTPIEYTRTRR